TTGSQNTANGVNALFNNTTGATNIGLGLAAGLNLTTGSNNIEIGHAGVAGESGKIRIGTAGTQTAAFIAGIRGATVPSGVTVIAGASGQLGTIVSAARFKQQIKPMDQASEAILALEPVTFRYRRELDPEGIPQFGLVAEEVAKVNPDLVARDAQGKVYTVRYEAVNAMLLNEFLKQHRKVEEQDRKVQEQDRKVEEQERKVQEQDRKVQEQAATISQLKSIAAKQAATIAQ
ncbi:MAG: tail fiber domain-containing protein, partial [Methylococcales bacterium]